MKATRFTFALIGLCWTVAPLSAQADDADGLAKILVAGDEWKVVVDKLVFADGPSCDADGNFYFSDLRGKGIFKISPDGTQTKVLEVGMSGTKFGPDGRLYACGGGRIVALELPSGKETVLAEAVQPNDLVVSHKGHIYFTETGKKQVTFLDPQTKELRVADVGINKPNGLTLSPDQNTLAVSDYGGLNVWTFRIQGDAKLADKRPAMTMKAPDDKPEIASGDGMTVDTAGRWYVTTALGVQIFEPSGKLIGIVPKPQDGPLTSAGFAGTQREYLYVTCGDKIFRRKTQAQGALHFQPPIVAATSSNSSDSVSTLNVPPEGFVALFNEKDLAGWRGGTTENPLKRLGLAPKERAEKDKASVEDIHKHWRVETGELVNDGTGLYMTTNKDYGDFELRIEYKTVAKADSGIYLRGIPQVQIWDIHQPSLPSNPDRNPNRGSGGLFNNLPKSPGRDPLMVADKPFGEWNSFRITMVGESVTVLLNDKLVVDNAPLHNYFDKGQPLIPVGPIQLQTHGGEIRWRNIFLREIQRPLPETGKL